MNTNDAKDYLSKRQIPHLFEVRITHRRSFACIYNINSARITHLETSACLKSDHVVCVFKVSLCILNMHISVLFSQSSSEDMINDRCNCSTYLLSTLFTSRICWESGLTKAVHQSWTDSSDKSVSIYHAQLHGKLDTWKCLYGDP